MIIFYFIILGIIGISVILTAIVLIKNKLTVEKIVALDVITTIITSALLIFSLIFDNSFVLDIAIIYAILSFGAVVVTARFHEKGV